MELRYCELCGDIIKVQGDSDALPSNQYVCDRCAAKKDESSAKPKQKAEDVSLRSAATPGAQQGEQATAPAGGGLGEAAGIAKELNLAELVMSKDLDLFSADTVARKQKEYGSKHEQAQRSPTQTKIRLLDPDEPGAEAPVAAPATEAKAGATGSRGVPKASSGGTATATGSKVISKTQAKRLQFPCPTCRAKLSVRPVSKSARMQCPKCRSRMTIDANRRVKLIEAGAKASERTAKSRGQESSRNILDAPLMTCNPDAMTEAIQPPPAFPVATQHREARRTASDEIPYETPRESVPRPKAPSTAIRREPQGQTAEEKETERQPTHRYYGTPTFQRGDGVANVGKAVLLAATIAVPFTLWAVLLVTGQTEPVSTYLQAYGELVKECFDWLALHVGK